MTKTELLARLEEGVKIEESAIVIYSRHFTDTLFFSGFDEARRQKIRDILQTLHDDSQRHRVIFERLGAEVCKGEKNVY